MKLEICIKNKLFWVVLIGFIFKIISTIIFYQYYFSEKNTVNDITNFVSQLNHINIFFENRSISEYINFLFTNNLDKSVFQNTGIDYEHIKRVMYFLKFNSIFNLIVSNQSIYLCFLMSLLMYLSSCVLMIYIYKYYDNFFIPFVLSFIFNPLFVFWTSALHKECFVFNCLFISFLMILKMIKSNNFIFKLIYFVFFLALILIIYLVKSFLLLVFLLSIVSYLIFFLFQEKFILFLISSFIALIMILISFKDYLLYLFSMNNQYFYQIYSLSNLNKIKNFTLDNYTFSYFSIIKNYFILALNGTFLPLYFSFNYLVIFILSLSNLFIVVSFILLIKQEYMLKRNYFKHIYILFICLFIGFLVASTCPNYVTLDRYKTMYMPFFLFYVLYHINKNDRKINNSIC